MTWRASAPHTDRFCVTWRASAPHTGRFCVTWRANTPAPYLCYNVTAQMNKCKAYTALSSTVVHVSAALFHASALRLAKTIVEYSSNRKWVVRFCFSTAAPFLPSPGPFAAKVLRRASCGVSGLAPARPSKSSRRGHRNLPAAKRAAHDSSNSCRDQENVKKTPPLDLLHC